MGLRMRHVMLLYSVLTALPSTGASPSSLHPTVVFDAVEVAVDGGLTSAQHDVMQSAMTTSDGEERRRLRRRVQPRYHHHHHHHQHPSLHPCDNNGTFINGRCECPYPYVGAKCTEYACEHGLSVGPRYDPESVFFNRRCICDEDWAGDFCSIPINDQCNERGQYIKGRCKCHGYYFGPACQYVGKCENGKLQEGKCECSYGYEGDYCDKIVCHHGYRDKANNSDSCICPPRHTGRFCDECRLKGPHVLAYPNCTLEVVPYHARLSRQKTDSMIVMRLIILLAAMGLLSVLLAAMLLMHWGRMRASDPRLDIAKRRTMEDRKQTLERAIFLEVPNGQARQARPQGLSTARRNSRFTDPDRLDHDLI